MHRLFDLLGRIGNAILRHAKNILLHLVDKLLQIPLVIETLFHCTGGHFDQLTQQVQLSNLVDEVLGLRCGGNTAADLREVSVTSNGFELLLGLQLFGQNRNIHWRIFLINFTQFLVD